MSRESPPVKRLLTDDISFDTVVPAHFAMAGYEHLFRRMFAGRAHIPGAVYRELDGLGHSDPKVHQLLSRSFFKVTTIVEEAARARIVDRMEAWTSVAEVAANPKKNRGESEAIQLAVDSGGWPIVTQDGNGRRGAWDDGLDCYSSIDVLVAMVIGGYVTDCDEAWDIYLALDGSGLYEAPGWPYDDRGKARLVTKSGVIMSARAAWLARQQP